jgi:ubiquinone/menaquinone biosynthesis C-methylase UbiE
MKYKVNEHHEKIQDQFAKQAIPFNTIKGHYDSVDTIIHMSNVSKHSTVLDIACGTGIVSCAFASYAKSVHGLDITKEMLQQAIKLQQKEGLTNITFEQSNVEELPFEDNCFDVVFTRYSFHHFLEPKKVFDEMLRVCKPNGRVIVVDVALEEKYSKAYNKMEKLRDPSHTKALSFSEFYDLFSIPSLCNHQQSFYEVNLELEEQLNASFPNKGDDEKIREIFRTDLSQDILGMKTHLVEGKIHFSYPITVFVAQKVS